MTQLIKCLPYKHDDLSFDPQNPSKKQVEGYPYGPSTRGGKDRFADSRGLLTSQPSQLWKLGRGMDLGGPSELTEQHREAKGSSPLQLRQKRVAGRGKVAGHGKVALSSRTYGFEPHI